VATYKGFNDRVGKKGFLVTKDGEMLDPARSQKVYNHSPDGFNWGYGGSGPAQLALALLLEETDVDTATRLYQPFKWQVIAELPKDEIWSLASEDIQNWLKAQHMGQKT
jgi:hypothetical protein